MRRRCDFWMKLFKLIIIILNNGRGGEVGDKLGCCGARCAAVAADVEGDDEGEQKSAEQKY
jgi:hypothetical protein